ncbi:1-phosphatidylinositol phosphodiesterase [Colletotrichum kahawae]|uniref:1-phosphatidylinositol phosphodiesterase n=1 Tax=Colletotrichum kahawae TaxID=34407 RepID=A0AAE0CXR3_COLKA|nr:1-phosphatidylinositol phosphodiesterase [Colletotrichum kahawae]
MAVGTKSPLASFLHQQAEKWTGHQVVVWRCDKGEIEFSCDTLHAHFDQGGPKPHTYFSKGGYTYGLCVIIDGTFQYINSSMTKDNHNLYVLSTAPGVFNEEKGFSFTPQSKLKSTSWMQYLSPDVPLDKVTLPGTRYSCASASNIEDADVHLEPEDRDLAQSIKNMHIHHDDSISQQLNKGIRLLDICCGVDNFVSHGPLTIANTYVEDALDAVKRFLENNDKETVVVLLNWSSFCLKVDSAKPWQEGGFSTLDDEMPAGFHEYMKTILKDDKFYYTGNTWPKLNEVRGKAVIGCGWTTDDHDHLGKWGVACQPPKWQLARFSTPYSSKQLIGERWEKIKNELCTSPDKHRAIVLAGSLQHDPNPKTKDGWIVPRTTAAGLQEELRSHIKKRKEEDARGMGLR